MDLGFGNWVTVHASRYPSRPALADHDGSRSLTYGDLEARTNAVAASLSAKGIRRGDRVAMLTLNSIEMLEIYIACAKLGAIAVPVNFRLAPPEVEYVLRDSGAQLLFTSPALVPVAEAACTPETFVRERIVVPDAAMRAAGDGGGYAELLNGDPTRVVRDITHDDVCVIMYTSGTTGRPKGAMLTHGNFQWNAIHGLRFGSGVGYEDVCLTAAPLFHIGALGVQTLPFLYAGASTVMMEAFEPGAWIAAAERHRITMAFAVPAMWAAIAHHPSIDAADLGSLEFAITGGAPCPVPVIERLQSLGMAFTEGFGMTETSPNACYLPQDDVVRKAGSIGKPVMHMDFRLVRDDGSEAAVGEVGELVVRGPNVFVGYWDKPQATAEAIREGWFHTGDLGKIDEEGFYTLVDRKKDMIISGGENIYPIEVEQAMVRHPDVNEVAVVGRPDEKWGETVVAVVVRAEGSSLTAEDLIDWTRQQIAHFKSPRVVDFVDALPRNATGKVLKREIRAKYTESGTAVQR